MQKGRAVSRPAPSHELLTLAILADHPGLLEQAETRDLISLLTDSRLRDMYSAARAGEAMWWSLPSADRAMTEQKPTGRPDTPFPKHWLYYIAIKIALLAGATALVLKLYGFW